MGQWQWARRGLWHPREIQREGRVVEKGMKLFRESGSVELGQVSSCSAMQGLGLGNRKVRSPVVGEDRSRLPGRRTDGEVRRGGKRAGEKAVERIHRFRINFGRDR